MFFIGATGHIGAAVLRALKAAFPGLLVVALVRSEKDLEVLKDRYPDAFELTRGSLDDIELVEAEGAKAQLVIDCAPDASTSIPQERLASEMTLMISTHSPSNITHAATDTQVAAGNSESVDAAIISPCFVVGESPIHSHAAPITFPDLMQVTKHAGGPFTILKGQNLTSFVDTNALAELYTFLAKDALNYITNDNPTQPDKNIWFFMTDYLIPSLTKLGGGAWVTKESVAELTLNEVVSLIVTGLEMALVQIYGAGPLPRDWGQI
ncbi:hypothetical protein B0H63DRAFT_546829 [Podospora didyma]|uniref:NAD(P)-binding domain-containing protein n=1 Tax=Podospora didyma TaxID=330526 RepID=A0AAE0KJK8_9PEZI|nr:hypothetical protein B0H63DRAFT_546829 [Podospora didyma]